VTSGKRVVISAIVGLVTLVLGLAVPAEAATTTFAAAVKKAVGASAHGFSPRVSRTARSDSEIAGGPRMVTDEVLFQSGTKVILVRRSVGALREATATARVQAKRVLAGESITRAGAGTRPAVVTSTAASGSTGLTVLSWTERSGVNYTLAARGGVSAATLTRIARALPKDGATVSAATRGLIARAEPLTATANVDKTQKYPSPPNTADKAAALLDGGTGLPGSDGIVALSTGNLNVDGAGVSTDDLNNEATLCNGCSYSLGNYAGMWQTILWADGKLSSANIDCQFGSQTASATRSWQSHEGLGSDGIVGPNTRSKASSYLIGGTYISYVGLDHYPTFYRHTSNNYYYDSDDSIRISYNLYAIMSYC
jgi:peptidoglycan hydrolase-like protein with peptidoglycan-binding domain